MTDRLKIYWEKRSVKSKFLINSVLFKSFSGNMNNYLHFWQINQIKKVVDKMKISSHGQISILDIGCGYGRVSRYLKDKLNCACEGIDISNNFVKQYQVYTGENAYCFDITTLEHQETLVHKNYDLIIISAVLVYLKNAEIQRVMEAILRFLKKDGRIIIMENNMTIFSPMFWATSLNKFLGQNKSIKLNLFSRHTLTRIFKKKYLLEDVSGIPSFSMLIPILILLDKINFNTKPLYSLANFLDTHLPSFLPSFLLIYILRPKIK